MGHYLIKRTYNISNKTLWKIYRKSRCNLFLRNLIIFLPCQRIQSLAKFKNQLKYQKIQSKSNMKKLRHIKLIIKKKMNQIMRKNPPLSNSTRSRQRISLKNQSKKKISQQSLMNSRKRRCFIKEVHYSFWQEQEQERQKL